MGPRPLAVPTDLPELVLRDLTADDSDAYYELVNRNRDHLRRHGDYARESNATRDSVIAYFADPSDHNIRFGIWLGSELIGQVDLNPVDPPHYTIGYWLSGDRTGHGHLTRACRAAIRYGRDALSATDIFAGVTHGNDESVAVLRRLGFARVASFERYDRYQPALATQRPD
jgi:RimJ/RimL family protein N-acetyltransferase